MKWHFLGLLLILPSGCTDASKQPETIGVAASDLVIPGLFSTGVDALGVPLATGATDPHYVMSSTDPALPGPIAVASNAGAGWTGNTPTSKWISGQTSDAGAANAVFTYTTTFALAGVNPASASITGKWTCDDTCIIKLNGVTVASNVAANAWTNLVNFTVPVGSPFALGANQLQFIVTNSGGGITGLQISTISGTVNGCTLDSQCVAADYCDTQAASCTPTLPNGDPIPTITGHDPSLTGQCNDLVGAAVCVSGVCDTTDDKCGYLDGDGPCTMGDATTVCRSGNCSNDGLCDEPGTCHVDSDCNMMQWCNESLHTCEAKLPNGTIVPTDPPHTNPTLDAVCSADAGLLVCVSGVCDTADNLCGYANGDGPCTSADGATVCRSTLCATQGVNSGKCVACLADGDCTNEVCDTTTNACVQCTATDTSACKGATPVCDVTSTTCVPCDGDFGSGSKAACNQTTSPFCFLNGSTKGQCGKCTMDSDCVGHPSGDVCDTTSGVCVTACHSDADCATGDWCNAPTDGTGACVPKLDNGTPLPGTPTNVSNCTDAVGQRVCKSGVCDPKDNTCGLADGDGPCTNNDECRKADCDASTNTCLSVVPGCKTDADCLAADYCATDGSCKTKQDPGTTCDTPHQCQSDSCSKSICDGLVSVSGSGILCEVELDPSNGDRSPLIAIAMVVMGFAARRKRTA